MLLLFMYINITEKAVLIMTHHMNHLLFFGIITLNYGI